jgi:serine/threonine-protein kinase
LAEGLAEDLIDELSMLRGVKVRPLGAVLPFANARADPRDVGRALGVQVIVEGALRIRGSKFHGRIALVSVAEGFQLLAERFEGDAASLFEISGRAAAAIGDALLGRRLAARRRPPSDPQVVESYLAARRALRVHWYGAPEEAMKLFERARELAPDDPRILSGAAIATARCTFLGKGGLERLRIAEELAERAVRAAPEWPEPYVARAIVHLNRGQLGASLAELGRALDRSPDNVDAHELVGQLRLEVGPIDVALAHLKTTLDLDSGVYKARWELSHAYALSARFDEADALLAVEVADDGQRRVRDAMRSRFDLWRGAARWDAELEASDDGTEGSIVRFIRARREVVRAGALSEATRSYAMGQVDGAPAGSRLQLVLMQFVTEMLAGSRELDAASAMVERAAAAGLGDRVWLEHCPLLVRLGGHEAFLRAKDVVERRVDAMLALT